MLLLWSICILLLLLAISTVVGVVVVHAQCYLSSSANPRSLAAMVVTISTYAKTHSARTSRLGDPKHHLCCHCSSLLAGQVTLLLFFASVSLSDPRSPNNPSYPSNSLNPASSKALSWLPNNPSNLSIFHRWEEFDNTTYQTEKETDLDYSINKPVMHQERQLCLKNLQLQSIWFLIVECCSCVSCCHYH